MSIQIVKQKRGWQVIRYGVPDSHLYATKRVALEQIARMGEMNEYRRSQGQVVFGPGKRKNPSNSSTRFPSYRIEKMGGGLVLLAAHRDGKSYDAYSSHDGMTTVAKDWVKRMTRMAQPHELPNLRKRFGETVGPKRTPAKRSNPSKKSWRTSPAGGSGWYIFAGHPKRGGQSIGWYGTIESLRKEVLRMTNAGAWRDHHVVNEAGEVVSTTVHKNPSRTTGFYSGLPTAGLVRGRK